MNDKLHIRKENTSNEILARIVKVVSHKYDCDMVIDFNNGNRVVQFIGEEAHKARIVDEIDEILGNRA